MRILRLIKYKLLKKYIIWRRTHLDKPIYLDEIQKKSVELFKIYLKNSDTNLVCSFMSGKRHIELNDVLISLNNTNRGYVLTVIDENENNSINCYEVNLPEAIAFDLVSLFDTKMERRLIISETSKKSAISKDLDLLIMDATKNISKNERS